MVISTLPKRDFSGYRAIIASPSVGNVSQLCLDLVISSLQCSHLGMIWHEGVLPLFGADPYSESSNKICSSNDVYFSEINKLLLIQLRAPVQKDHVVDYLRNLLEYFKSINIEDIVVLSGLFAHQRNDSEILGGPFRYVTCPKSNEKFGNQLESYGWLRMKGNDGENNFACPKLMGAGLTRTLFSNAVEMNISCTGLLLFCSEGDNSDDSLQLLKKLNTLLSFMPNDLSNVVYPPSWKYLFGNSLPKHLY